MVGGRWSKIIACVVLATTLSVCLAGSASAEGEEDTGGFGAFRLKGTHGFSILVLAFSKPHFKHGEAIVWATNKRNASVIYLAPATVTATTIDADLGAVGEISLAFEPSGSPETGELTGQQVRGARLVARSAGKKQAIYLQANQNHPGAPVYMETSIEERRGGLIVSREVVDHFSSGAFDFASPLRTATLAPPAPFAGQATFRRNADPANRWTGNLSVDFPGRADVSLAGKRFKAALVHAKRTEEVTLYDRLARPKLSGAAFAASLPPK
jgi:hypothetical protein